MNNDIVLREYPRQGPSTINVSSRRENRNLQPAAVHVQQHPAEIPNINNERERMEFQDPMVLAHMVYPTKICRICGRGWPELWMPNVCNCPEEISRVHPVCMQYYAEAENTRRCSACGVDQFSERKKEKEEERKEEKRVATKQEKSILSPFIKACCSNNCRYCCIFVLMILAMGLILFTIILFAQLYLIKGKN